MALAKEKYEGFGVMSHSSPLGDTTSNPNHFAPPHSGSAHLRTRPVIVSRGGFWLKRMAETRLAWADYG